MLFRSQRTPAAAPSAVHVKPVPAAPQELPPAMQGVRFHAQRKPALPFAARAVAAPEPAVEEAAAIMIARSFRARRAAGMGAPRGGRQHPCLPRPHPQQQAPKLAAAALAIQGSFRRSLMRRRAAVLQGNHLNAPVPRPSRAQPPAQHHQVRQQPPLPLPLPVQPVHRQLSRPAAAPHNVRAGGMNALPVRRTEGTPGPVGEVQRAKEALIFASPPEKLPIPGHGHRMRAPNFGEKQFAPMPYPAARRPYIQRRPLPVINVR